MGMVNFTPTESWVVIISLFVLVFCVVLLIDMAISPEIMKRYIYARGYGASRRRALKIALRIGEAYRRP
jgi:hypothetical protein